MRLKQEKQNQHRDVNKELKILITVKYYHMKTNPRLTKQISD